MIQVSTKPSLYPNDPSVAFYDAVSDIAVYICLHANEDNFYRVQLVGPLERHTEVGLLKFVAVIL